MFIFAPAGNNSGYKVQRSVRLRAAASAYFNRPQTSGDARTLTRVYWIKRGAQGVSSGIESAGTDSNNFTGIVFRDDDTLQVFQLNLGTVVLNKISTRVFRDPSAFLNIVVVFDTNNSVAEDKVRIYVDNERITSFSTNVNFSGANTTYFNDAPSSQLLGRLFGGSYADCYFSEVIGVDGQALPPSSFGEQDPATRMWVPKSPSRVRAAVAAGGGVRNGFGANGSYEPFSDITSTTTLGYDRSQSDTDTTGNNWTANNISLTDGGSYDSMLDVPGLPWTDGGTGRGNYATLNPLNTNVQPTAGNLVLSFGSAAWAASAATISLSSGKWYWERSQADLSASIPYASGMGFRPLGQLGANESTGGISGSFGAVANDTVLTAYTGAVAGGTLAGPYGATKVFNAAIDFDAGKIWLGNGTAWIGGGDPVAGTSPTYTFTPGTTLVPYVSSFNNTSYPNFGQRPFAYTPPTGFKALHTGNLTSDTVITSGSFAGNVSADGPFIWMNGCPETLTINGNAVTFGTHADRLANGFKLRTSSASYNSSGTNTWTATVLSPMLKSSFRNQNAKGNP